MTIHELFAYLCVKDARAAMTFYAAVFGAKEKFRLTEPAGRIGHAEVDFGGATLMITEEYPEYGIAAPSGKPPHSATLHLHVDDADAVIARAVAAGATLEREAADQFYGERSGSFIDPFGHRWNVGHSIETLSPAEMQRRYDEIMKDGG